MGRAFRKRGLCSWARVYERWGPSESFAGEILGMNPIGFSHHVKVHTRAVVTTLGSQGDRGTMVWRAPTLKQGMNFDMNFLLSASVPSAVVEM